jgi:protocatechuate 4,5-dioxygenase alpha chain
VQPTVTTRFQLNQFFADTQKAEGLAAYRADPKTYLARYTLDPELRAAIERKDIAAMYRAGANPYLLRFFCVNMGVTEPDYLSALHGMKED